MNTIHTDDRAVSQVIAILMIVILVLVALIAVVVLFPDNNPKPDTKSASFTGDFRGNGSDTVTITHEGGDELKASNITVVIDGAMNSVTSQPYFTINGRHKLTSLGYHSESLMKPSDSITLNKSSLGVEDEINFKEAEIRLIYRISKSRNITYYSWTHPDV